MSSSSHVSEHPLSVLEAAAPDAIFGLTESFKRDARPQKVNLCAGVYLNDKGMNPVPVSVKQAEGILLENEQTKSYLSIEGEMDYGMQVQELLFGAEHQLLGNGHAVTLHTPGGTGALRLAADLAHSRLQSQVAWLSEPTWANHGGIFQAAGLKLARYPYLDIATHSVRAEALLASLEQVRTGDLVVLHACCHNPSGVDIQPELWQQIAKQIAKNGALALVDFAYQGFGQGLAQDAQAVRLLAHSGQDLMVAQSFSKNMGLYRERTGSLTLVCQTASQAQHALSQAKLCARVQYSNPPAHGGKIAALILSTPELKTLWEQEVTQMRTRIHTMRAKFAQCLHNLGVPIDFSFLTQQNGMFALTGLSTQHAHILRQRFAVYLLDSGRINVSALTPDNLEYVCQSIAAVLD